jgi:hypothetical protein
MTTQPSMTALTRYEKWYGRAKPPPETIPLRAGRLTAEFQAGDLRYIRLGSQELIRRVYVAVRDANWNTIPAHISQLEIDSADTRFRIRYQAFHQTGPLAFRWNATITGDPDGQIRFIMDGATESAFRYCRIGFCVLHPIRGIAGAAFRAQTPAGPVDGTLPEPVAPQLIEDGFEVPLFPSCSQLVITTLGGIDIRTDFEGDLFEMEDQRNWTDGSFKTYCTPLSLGYPHQATAGQTIRQAIRISAAGSLPESGGEPRQANEALSLSPATSRQGTLPRIGFGLPAENPIPNDRQTGLLAALRPAHLKVEVHLARENWATALQDAIQAAEQLGCPLELALFLTDNTTGALDQLAARLAGVRVARVIVFHEAEAAVTSTAARYVRLVRDKLGGALPGAPFVGGTNGNFAELNRARPDTTAIDGLSFTINPQVHADDELSLIEAIEAQRDVVATARRFSNGLPIVVSSVTLKPPFNQAATEAEAPPDPLTLPAAVDARQMSLFAAAWTVGSLRALAEGGAESVTYYETLGWRGLMATAQGSPLPAEFRAGPGMIFPVYWVFQALAAAGRSSIRPLEAGRPQHVDGFGFQSGGQPALLLANLQPETQPIVLAALPNGEARLMRLNEDTMPIAGANPDGFEATTTTHVIRDGAWQITLLPYETVFLQFTSS